MNSRDMQLGKTLCDQDKFLLDLIADREVKIVGDDGGFSKLCKLCDTSEFCLIFFNRPLWLSQARDKCQELLCSDTKQVYIGINRYQLKGNDTSSNSSVVPYGQQLVNFFTEQLQNHNFAVKACGFTDNDKGKFFNFIQPLTWIYAERETVAH